MDDQSRTLDGYQKLALCLWITVCLLGFTWFISKMIAGRQRMRLNFASIEEHLKKLQKSIEEEEEKEKKALVLDDAKQEELQVTDKKTD